MLLINETENSFVTLIYDNPTEYSGFDFDCFSAEHDYVLCIYEYQRI